MTDFGSSGVLRFGFLKNQVTKAVAIKKRIVIQIKPKKAKRIVKMPSGMMNGSPSRAMMPS
jgi:hypothetical protein